MLSTVSAYKNLSKKTRPLYLVVFTCFFMVLYVYFNLGVAADNTRNTSKININNNHKTRTIVSKIQRPLPVFEKTDKQVILFVWDGLRPDIITPEYTPNLYKLKQKGSYFADHHSSYPTVTMNNANSLATGNYSGETGFYGNSVWRPDLAVKNASIKKDFSQPVFTQDHFILNGLDKAQQGKPLMYVETLLQVARKNGLKTAQVGKAGPVALQDAHKPDNAGIVISENKIYPLAFAQKIQKKGYKLPKESSKYYTEKQLNLLSDNGDPTKKENYIEIRSIDGTVPLIGLSDPSVATDALYRQGNQYLMDIYLKEVLPEYHPEVSVIWFREPDTTAHKYGPGTKPFYKALMDQDKLLGKLLLYMNKLGIEKTTNLMIVSDHGHSNVSANFSQFPLREIKNSKIGEISKNGYSVSGSVRVAELLTNAGFKTYDGRGCGYNPIMHGMYADRNLKKSINVDLSGKLCKEGKGRLYTTKSYMVPNKLPKDSVVAANNGGSVFLYLPDKNKKLLYKLVRYLQSRIEFDGIFVDRFYGDVPGTLPLTKVNFYDDKQSRHPDLLVAMSYDDKQIIQGLAGTLYTSDKLNRGSHGSLSPIEINNVLIAIGPNFKQSYEDVLPTANVDVPVTIAHILKLPFSYRTGRPILEALSDSEVRASDYLLKYSRLQPKQPAVNLKIKDELGKTNKDSYNFVLNTKQLYYKGKKYNYIDSGKAIRY